MRACVRVRAPACLPACVSQSLAVSALASVCNICTCAGVLPGKIQSLNYVYYMQISIGNCMGMCMPMYICMDMHVYKSYMRVHICKLTIVFVYDAHKYRLTEHLHLHRVYVSAGVHTCVSTCTSHVCACINLTRSKRARRREGGSGGEEREGEGEGAGAAEGGREDIAS